MARLPLCNALAALVTTLFMLGVNAQTPPTYTCAANNGSTVTDPSGIKYVIGCSETTAYNTIQVMATTIGFDDCFYNCSNQILPAGTARCSGFTFSGFAAGGTGPGNCNYLTNSPNYFMYKDPQHVSAIMVR